MLKSELKPLASRPAAAGRQKLAVVDPMSVAGVALAIGTGAAGNFVATWVYNKYVSPRRKNKANGSKFVSFGKVVEVETVEERIVRTKIRTKTVRIVGGFRKKER